MAVVPASVDHVVKNMAETLRFYRLLGLDIPPSADEEPAVEFETPNGYTVSFSLESMFVELGGPKWADLSGRGRVRMAFQCDTIAEVDEVHRRMTEAGYVNEAEPWDAFWGQRFAQLLDPDGCMVDIFAPLGQSTHE